MFDGLVDHPSQLSLGDIANLQDVPENDFKVLGKCWSLYEFVQGCERVS